MLLLRLFGWPGALAAEASASLRILLFPGRAIALETALCAQRPRFLRVRSQTVHDGHNERVRKLSIRPVSLLSMALAEEVDQATVQNHLYLPL